MGWDGRRYLVEDCLRFSATPQADFPGRIRNGQSPNATDCEPGTRVAVAALYRQRPAEHPRRSNRLSDLGDHVPACHRFHTNQLPDRAVYLVKWTKAELCNQCVPKRSLGTRTYIRKRSTEARASTSLVPERSLETSYVRKRSTEARASTSLVPKRSLGTRTYIRKRSTEARASTSLVPERSLETSYVRKWSTGARASTSLVPERSLETSYVRKRSTGARASTSLVPKLRLGTH